MIKGDSVYLHLNICELELELKISNWISTEPSENWTKNWCETELRLHSQYVNYDNSGELLISGEVLTLRDMLAEILSGEMKEEQVLPCMEPDLYFGFKPSAETLEIMVTFWDGRLPQNSLVTRFERVEIEALYVYLRFVTGEIDCNDDAVVKLINAQVLVEE